VDRWLLITLLVLVAALVAAAVYAVVQARAAERKTPPIGHFLEVDGVRLHYLEQGQGEPVVLLHGNGGLIQDLTVSGLMDGLSGHHRVIMFDRPGFGYSTRPRSRIWTPQAQAEVLRKALDQLGVKQAVVLGHSWGTLVAVSLALQAPTLVRGLVLLSGYYFPTARLDVPLLLPPAIPVIGDVMRYTVSPLLGRLLLPPLIRKLFEPAPVPERFDRLFPTAMTLRPSHLRASAADTALMVPAAAELQARYRELKMPVTIMTGADDQVVDAGRQSRRLHAELSQSRFISLPGLGHMVHHLAPDQAMQAVEQVVPRPNALPPRRLGYRSTAGGRPSSRASWRA
jgi:pimeloyl-ACP methyl ester carboxylesterase